MLDVRLSYTLKPNLLDEFCDARQPCAHICGKGFNFCINSLIEGRDNPAHS